MKFLFAIIGLVYVAVMFALFVYANYSKKYEFYFIALCWPVTLILAGFIYAAEFIVKKLKVKKDEYSCTLTREWLDGEENKPTKNTHIFGDKFPERCEYCPYAYYKTIDSKFVCACDEYEETRPDDCPFQVGK